MFEERIYINNRIQKSNIENNELKREKSGVGFCLVVEIVVFPVGIKGQY